MQQQQPATASDNDCISQQIMRAQPRHPAQHLRGANPTAACTLWLAIEGEIKSCTFVIAALPTTIWGPTPWVLQPPEQCLLQIHDIVIVHASFKSQAHYWWYMHHCKSNIILQHLTTNERPNSPTNIPCIPCTSCAACVFDHPALLPPNGTKGWQCAALGSQQ
jgi:hypothetical protein